MESSLSSSPPLYYRVHNDDHHIPVFGIEPEIITVDNFDIRIHLFQNISPWNSNQPTQRNYIPFFVDIIHIPCQLLPSQFPPYLQQLFSGYLPSDKIQALSSYVISYAHSMLNDPNISSQGCDNDHHRLLPLTLEIIVPSTTTLFEGGDVEDLDMITNRVMEQSMQQVKMIPASEKAIALLKKVEEMSCKLNEADQRCIVCLEDFEEGDGEVLRMPCDHVFHKSCIVKWLKTSHMCPLCRFQMPIQ